MRSAAWLFGQFVLVAAAGVVFIGVVVAVWYGLSFLVLGIVSRIFRLRGRGTR